MASLLLVDYGSSLVKIRLYQDQQLQDGAAIPAARGADGMVDLLEQIVRAADADQYALCTVGSHAPDGGVTSANLSLEAAPLGQLLAERLGQAPAVLVSDLTAICVGEASRGSGDAAIINLAGGVGARVCLNGQPVLGSNGAAGEIGHWAIDSRGRLCRCGRHGCLETVCGWHHIQERFDGTMQHLREQLDAGDQQAAALLQEIADAVAVMAAALISCHAPAEVRLTGPLPFALGRHLLEAVQTRVNAQAFAPVPLDIGRLGDSAALFGLAQLADYPVIP